MPDTSLHHFTGYLRNHWFSPRRIRFWLLVVVAAYTLVGFFALPRLIEHVAVDTVRDRTGHELQIEALHTNPYTLTLQIEGLTLSSSDEAALIQWDHLFANLTWSSVIDRTWTFSEIRFDGLTVTEARFASGETRLTRLLEAFSGEAPSDDTTNSDQLPGLRVEKLHAEGAAFHFTDNVRDPTAPADDQPEPTTLSVRDVHLAMNRLSLQKGARFPAQLHGQLAGGGEFAVDGMVQLLPMPAFEGETRVEKLALAPFEPYLRRLVIVRIDTGTLSLDGTIRHHAGEPLAFLGSVSIDTLSISEDSGEHPLIGWQTLQTDRLDLKIGERRLETDAIDLNGLSGQVLIREDRTTNFSRILAVDEPELGENNESANPDPLAITIAGIDLADGAVEFTDHSLPLPFSTNIQALSGNISTLSSESAEPAQVQLEGRVKDHGLANIDGTVHAWNPMRQTSVQLGFRNISIPDYSPYTVYFAGRRISAGTMDLDLDYTIAERQLDGHNNVVMKNLQLGERMDAPNAMDLPLDMALALLRDQDDVIDLNVPVSGNVGEPDFDLGQVIRQALGNAVVSIVQAPFSFLASLVGAESEDLGRVDFPVGRSDLTPPQRERIDTLRKALEQRPALALELAGPFDPVHDAPPLRQQSAINELGRRLAEAGREVEDLSLSAESTIKTVEAMFASRYPETNLEQVRARFTKTDDESPEQETFDALAYRNHLAEQVVAAQPVTDTALKALGNARAAAVRDALTAPETGNGIAADRLRLREPVSIDSDDDQRVAMEIDIATK